MSNRHCCLLASIFFCSMGKEDEEEEVSSYRMALSKSEDTGI
jgi:hypothetical protein